MTLTNWAFSLTYRKELHLCQPMWHLARQRTRRLIPARTDRLCHGAIATSTASIRCFSGTLSRNALIPMVLSREEHGERSYDLYSRLMKERIVFLNGPIEDSLSSIIVAQLLFLEAEQPKSPIYLYINSPGGSVTSGMAIYDTMQYIDCDVHTICVGQASSMASLILAGGVAGHRSALPHASIMIHQPSGGSSGQASDISIVANEILRIRENMFDLYADHCKLPDEEYEATRHRFARMLDRDHYLIPEKAIQQGIIDTVLKRRPKNE